MKLTLLFASIITAGGCALLPSSLGVLPPQQPREFWVSTYATGNLDVTNLWKGSFANPLDGSTQARFDFNLGRLPAGAVIHLMPGRYTTLGCSAWGPKRGQQIVGSGMDATIVQFPPTLPSGRWMIHPASAAWDHVTVSDLTVDCNYQPGTTITMQGINLLGSGNAIRRVKLLNCASFAGRYSESFGLFINGNGGTNNEISGCVVENYLCNSNNNLSALGILGTSHASILNNTIKEVPGNPVFALGIIGDNAICESNLVEGCRYGFHADTVGGSTNVFIINNKFNGVAVAVFVANSCTRNMTFAFNEISLNNTNHGFYTAGMFFEKSGHYTNLFVYGNTASLGLYTYTPAFFNGGNITGLVIKNNRVASSLTNYISASTNVIVQDNYDLHGNTHSMNTVF